jgi:hypothetical protein
VSAAPPPIAGHGERKRTVQLDEVGQRADAGGKLVAHQFGLQLRETSVRDVNQIDANEVLPRIAAGPLDGRCLRCRPRPDGGAPGAAGARRFPCRNGPGFRPFPVVTVDFSQPKPVLPTIPSVLPDVEAKISSILAKLDKLEYEKIGADTRKMLETLNATLKDTDAAVNRFNTDVTPELKPAIEEFRSAMASADTMLKNTDATIVGTDAPGQQQFRDAMDEVARAGRSLRVLTDYLERHPDALIRGKSEEKP